MLKKNYLSTSEKIGERIISLQKNVSYLRTFSIVFIYLLLHC